MNQAVLGAKFLILLWLVSFGACAGNPDPVTLNGVMALEIEPAAPNGIKFGVVAETIQFETQAMANVEEADNFFQVNFFDFTAAAVSDPGYEISISLDPEMNSSGTISKLDDGGAPFQAHQLIFNLLVEINGQRLNFANVSLSGSEPNVGLDRDIEGQDLVTEAGLPATLKISDMQKGISGGLIDVTVSCGDCPCDYQAVPKTSDCWRADGLGDGPFFQAGVNCSLAPCDVPNSAFFAVDSDNTECQLFITNTACGTVQMTNQFNLTADQVAACQCQMEQYTTDLDNTLSLFGVVNGPPFDCTPPS